MSLTLGKKVKVIRAFCDLTQAELSKKVGINREYLSLFETDEMDLKPEKLKAIEEALGITSLDAPIDVILAELTSASTNPNTTLALAA